MRTRGERREREKQEREKSEREMRENKREQKRLLKIFNELKAESKAHRSDPLADSD